MLTELLKAILVPVIAVALKYALAALGVVIDEALFNTLVAAIVTYLLALLGFEAARAAFPARFK